MTQGLAFPFGSGQEAKNCCDKTSHGDPKARLYK